MKTIKITKRLMAIVAIVLVGISAMAQNVRKHIVDRGETLASIAEKYAVSKEDIVKLNPDADQFVYVGMELTIPEVEKKVEIVDTVVKEKQTSKENTAINNVEKKTNGLYNETNDYQKWVCCSEFGYGFLKKIEGVKGDATAYKISIGANYFHSKALYTGIRIGYNSSTYTTNYIYTGGYENTVTTCHLLCIPLELGCKLTFNESRTLGFTPFAGLDVNIGLSGKAKIKRYREESSTKLDIGGKLGVGARVGLKLCLWGFNVIGAYVFPINKKQEDFFGKDAYPEVAIGWGF